jgi:hypothetical protein
MSEVFISYSRKDRQWVEILGEFLRKHNISFWSDTEINPGENWREALENSLNTSQVVILLISPDYFASEFVKNFELPLILEKAKNQQIWLFALIVSPTSEVDDSLRQYQFVNLINEPLSSFSKTKQKEVFIRLLEEISSSLSNKKINELAEQRQIDPPLKPQQSAYEYINPPPTPKQSAYKYEVSLKEFFIWLLEKINSSFYNNKKIKIQVKQTIESTDKYSTALNAAIKNIGGNVESLNLLGGTNIFFEAEAALGKKDGK